MEQTADQFQMLMLYATIFGGIGGSIVLGVFQFVEKWSLYRTLKRDILTECELNLDKAKEYQEQLDKFRSKHLALGSVEYFNYFFDLRQIIFVSFEHVKNSGHLYRILSKEQIRHFLRLQNIYAHASVTILSNQIQDIKVRVQQGNYNPQQTARDLGVWESWFAEGIEILESIIKELK